MEPFNIIYRFQLTDKDTATVGLQLEQPELVLQDDKSHRPPDWAKLRYNQCPNCPLKPQESPYCPAAKHLSRFTDLFDKVQSFDKVKVAVKTAQRLTSINTTAEKAISAFIGFVMATSGCPRTAYFRPMARFHLPLSDEQETIYRVVSMYLLAQYFKERNDETPDWHLNELKKIYREVSTVNQSIGGRLREATKTDSSLNAIVNLDMYTKVVPDMIEESLYEIQELFSVYLDQHSVNTDFQF